MKTDFIFRQTVKEVLCDMAVNDTLPLDMTLLDIDDVFEKAAIKLTNDSSYQRILREENILKEAGRILFNDGSTEDLKAMVKTIIEHPDEHDFIEHIPNVYVCQLMESHYTAKSFCQEVGYTGNEFKD